VRIVASRRGDRLTLVVENPRDPDSPDPRGAGIGTQNVRRRMAALYGGDADMRIEKERESFRVELRLPCSR
jgi:LytS/YehU family sensor histidine kinase